MDGVYSYDSRNTFFFRNDLIATSETTFAYYDTAVFIKDYGKKKERKKHFYYTVPVRIITVIITT